MLAFYLHLRSSTKYAQRPSLLQSHPILQRLLTLKQSLATLEDLDFAGSDSEDDEDDGSMTMNNILGDGEQVWRFDGVKGLEPNELAELLEDAALPAKTPEKRTQTPPKKKRKTAQDRPKPSAPIFDLVEPQFVSLKSSSHEPHPNDSDAYGEMAALHAADLADKSARKKSLRFHTSKIDSASARRQGARNQAVGGDDDLPYRQRKKEKDAQLVKEAAKKLNNQGGEDLDDEDPEPRVGEKRSRKDEDDADLDEDPDEYYELVKKKSKEKKENKKAEYEETNGRVRYVLVYASITLLPDYFCVGLIWRKTKTAVHARLHEQF
jgi:U3 small nucleolar RNA-associated protein 3